MITNHTASSITTIIKPPLLSETLETRFWVNESGKVATIPTVIRSDIPFPIPLSVIFSPSHIAKIQPVTRIIIDDKTNIGVLPKINALSGTPSALSPYKYAGA